MTLQSLHLLCRPSLGSLPYVHVSFVLGNPQLDTALQFWPCNAEQKGRITFLDLQDICPMQPMVPLAFFVARTHCRITFTLVSRRTPRLFSSKHLSRLVFPSTYWCLGLFLLLWDFALPCAELHEVPVSTFLRPVRVPLGGSKTLQSVSHSSRWLGGMLRVPSAPSSRNGTLFPEEIPPYTLPWEEAKQC